MQVGNYKQRCRQPAGLQELFAGCPREYIEACQYVDGLK